MEFYTTAIIQGLAFACMGLGIFLTLKIFKIPDITTDGTYTLGGAVTAVMLTNGMSPLLTLVVVIFCGAAGGIATGWIHTRLKINALLAGILVMTALYSVNLAIMGRPNIPLIDDKGFSNQNIYLVVVVLVFIAVFFVIWLLKTDFGIAMRSTGSNPVMAQANGVNIVYMKVFGIALANAMTAISGFLMVQYQGFADINMGIGIVISGLAAVIIGESLSRIMSYKNIAITILFVVVGSIVFRVVLAFSLDMGMNPNYLKLVTAIIVLLIVGLSNQKFNKHLILLK